MSFMMRDWISQTYSCRYKNILLMLFKYESDNLNLIKVNIFHEKGKCRHLAIFRREADYSVLMVLTVGEAVKGWLEKIS